MLHFVHALVFMDRIPCIPEILECVMPGGNTCAVYDSLERAIRSHGTYHDKV